jgi:outer membrane protein insertion porin family
VRKSFENLKKLYGARGHINFTAVPAQDFDEQKKLVHLTINIDEDRQFIVNRIDFSGNTTTRDKVIRRELLVDESRVFNSSLWDLSILRLNQLGYFDEIKPEDAEIKPHPTEPSVDVSLKVKEKSRNSIGFNGGVSGVGGSFLGLSYSTNNFLGLGESTSVSLQGGTRQSQYQFSFTEPYLFNRPLATGFSVFKTSFRYDQAREVLGLDPSRIQTGTGFDDRLNFEQEQVGYSLTASYPTRIFHRLGMTYQANTSRTSAINPATQEFFNAVATQEQQSFRGSTGSYAPFKAQRLSPSYTVNTTNNPFNPTRGYSVTASMEFTGGFMGGNVNFYRPTIEYRFFKPVHNGRNTLAARALVSYAQGFNNVSVPFYERFFVGGDFDLRGFDFRSISPISFITRTTAVTDPFTGKTANVQYDDIVYVGGDTQGILNLEYRIPLAGPITLAPFADIGNSWVLKKRSLLRKQVDAAGHIRQEGVHFLPGTNSGVRISTGVELQVVMPVINQPFRLIFVLNPSRINRRYTGPVSGQSFSIREPGHDFKFTVGKTF